MKYLLIIVILSSGQREEISLPSLERCQSEARAITGDRRPEATHAFVSVDRKSMAFCRQK